MIESWPTLLLFAAVLFVAQVVYVAFGFGAGLIAVGTLALLRPELLQDIVVLLLLTALPVESLVVARSRKAIEWRGVGLLAGGVALGIPVGAWLLRHGRPEVVLLLLGWVLVVTGIVFALAPGRAAVRWPAWTAAPVGLLSGWLTGTFGTGGPPLVLYYHLGGSDKAAFRGNLMAVFLFGTILKVPVYVAMGLVTPARFLASLSLMPAVLLGAWTGQRIHVAVPEALFRRAVSVLLAVLGTLLLVRGP